MASSADAATNEPGTVGPASPELLVSALIPCLKEELTLGIWMKKAQAAFSQRGIVGEVVVGDNGSKDRSVEIGEDLGARVVHQPIRGNGPAISAAANEARGKYLITADADDSYDWSQLAFFIDALQDGADLLTGHRFTGGIDAWDMPPLHRYLGNPVLSAVARWLHRSPCRDFHCDMCGFSREAFARIGASSPSTEFASETAISTQCGGLAAAAQRAPLC